jgi:hypothetical protein
MRSGCRLAMPAQWRACGAPCRAPSRRPRAQFWLRTVPLFDGGDDVGMVLSPQCFHNLRMACDIFNHANVHFWEYMQPGYDALGFISCTGAGPEACCFGVAAALCRYMCRAALQCDSLLC